MRKLTCFAAGGGLLVATAGLLGGATAASASTASPVVGYTYVNDNTPTVNTVAGFDRHADGSLTAMPGSPFAIGSAGLGAGLGSQGAIQATQNGKYLLAVDAGSNQISVLHLSAKGVPHLVGQPVSSGGVEPVSITVHSSLVYVANTGAGGSNYTGFQLHGGTLTPIADSAYAVPEGSGLGDVFFNATGNRLVGTRAATSQIDSFAVLRDGRLAAAPGSPFTGQGLGQIGSEFSPAKPTQLFVSNAHNGAGLGTVSAYRDSSVGQLTPIGSSPYADGQTAPCWVTISHDGQYLFAINTGSGNISSYSINPGGSLHLISSYPISGGGADTDAQLSPDGNYLLVDGSGMHFVSVFAVNGGALTEVPSSPTLLPAGSSSVGIANI
ncbi:MAG TPA: beta-propeller fold lactonase family protein [Streptosporangiaceae bacterium]|jgi:6-phosphogluconolactonase (cycloisomerase 2 family)